MNMTALGRISLLKAEFYNRDPRRVARALLGKLLVRKTPRGILAGRIVETEAYLGQGDAAAHSAAGKTLRNAVLFGPPGYAYVYFIYGNHYMLNISGQRKGVGEGVLLRGLEPLEGIEWMQRHRHTKSLTELSRGPGRLAAAMRITRSLNGLDLCAKGPLWLGTAARPTGKIGVSVRIGITQDAHRLLRFYERGNPFVSGPKSLST